MHCGFIIHSLPVHLHRSTLQCVYSINAAPRIPTTAPKVSRRGIRVGTAPPVDPVDEAPFASGATGTEVAVPAVEVEGEVEATPVLLIVPLVTPVESGMTEPLVLVADTESLLALVLEGATEDELEDDAWST
jgi:hypothetical protein